MAHSDEFRLLAYDCLNLAHTTTDLHTRASLIKMAQVLFGRADKNGVADKTFDALLEDFNNRQMTE